MKYLIRNLVLLVLLYPVLISCKKAGGESGTNSNNSAPTNLAITANVNANGSGMVAFTATATNASTYVYEFGNGEIKTVLTGITDYQYTLIGNNTYNVTVTAKSSSGQSIKKTISVAVNVLVASPSLFWAEEFNTPGAPDAAKWGYDIGTGSNGWGNAELEYYTSRPENVIVADGVLKITAKKENYSGSAYTSTRLLSKDKFAFKYGKVEVRAKLPAGVGTWPAIWMLGSNFSTVGWPDCGEIDIVEHRGSELNKIFATLHYPGHFAGGGVGGTTMITSATTEFHKYTLDWTATYIKIYVDDLLYYTFNNTAGVPFNQNFFFILNVAIGGGFAGSVDPAFTSASMEVDYIRVYK